MNEPTHLAFGDESYKDAERFRSVTIVTLTAQMAEAHANMVRQLLQESEIEEFKWSKLRNAKYRSGAIKLINWSVEAAFCGQLRIDVLIWDTYDSRHAVQGRDDIANLQAMYRFLFRNVLQMRWPRGSTWALYPDENSALDWSEISHKLDVFSWEVENPTLFHRLPTLRQVYQLIEIREVDSKDAPLCQLADLYGGLVVYSWKHFETYKQWLDSQPNPNPPLIIFDEDPKEPAQFSNSDKARCFVLNHLDQECKKRSLSVSLHTNRGLRTYDPRKSVNFWPYQSQHPDDKAPVNK